MLSTAVRRSSSIGLALALLAALLVTAVAVANPAGANPADDTCSQVGENLVYELGEGRPFDERVNIRVVTANGSSSWVSTSDATGTFEINNLNSEYIVRYRVLDNAGDRVVIDVPCAVDPNPDDNIPRESINCTLDNGALRWNDSPNDNRSLSFNIREVQPDGSSVFVQNQSFGFFFVGETQGDYFIRYRLPNANGGIDVIDEPCVNQNADSFCVATNTSLIWDDVPSDGGVFHVREVLNNGKSRWLETTTGTQSFLNDFGREYIIRYRVTNANGSTQVINEPCR